MHSQTSLLALFYTVSVVTAVLVGATTYLHGSDPIGHMLALRCDDYD